MNCFQWDVEWENGLGREASWSCNDGEWSCNDCTCGGIWSWKTLLLVVVHFKADFCFCDPSGVLSVGVLEHKGMVNETFLFFELFVMDSIVCVLASLGTLNSRIPMLNP